MKKADLSQLEVEILWHEDMWQTIKDATMTTIGKSKGCYPDAEWKRKILMSEHSPIRIGHIVVRVKKCPSFVIGHLVRHVHTTPFVSTLRVDRVNYDEVPNRNTLQNAAFDINFQSFIDISRKRLCNCASYETRYVWSKVLDKIKEVEPELYSVCVPQCVREGYCYEFKSCNYHKTEVFKQAVKEYRKGINE